MPAVPEPPTDQQSKAKPFATRLRLALAPWTVHFKSPGYIRDDTMHMLEVTVCKSTLEETRKNPEVR